jgi:hypothetical protein
MTAAVSGAAAVIRPPHGGRSLHVSPSVARQDWLSSGVLSQSSIFGQNPKIWCQEFNDLETPKLLKKQLCDRTGQSPSLRAA